LPLFYFGIILFFKSGKCEIALFGDYVDDLKKLMTKAEGVLPVLVMQFAKLKIFEGVDVTLSF